MWRENIGFVFSFSEIVADQSVMSEAFPAQILLLTNRQNIWGHNKIIVTDIKEGKLWIIQRGIDLLKWGVYNNKSLLCTRVFHKNTLKKNGGTHQSSAWG